MALHGPVWPLPGAWWTMADALSTKLRRLILSASDLRKLADWPDPLVEDYINILSNLALLADEIDTKGDSLRDVKIITAADSPYVPDLEDEIFADTDSGAITISMPAGSDGRHFRITNVGSSDNAVTLVPYLTEKLFGGNDPEELYDAEVIDMTYNPTEGWY